MMKTGRHNTLKIIFIVVFAVLFNSSFAQEEQESTADKNHTEEVIHDVLVGNHENLNHNEEANEKEPFSAAEMIMDHIGDSHEWHIWGKGDASVSLPLPIILYHEEKGFSIFLSNNFHHGHSEYKGYRLLTEHFLHKHDIDPSDYPHDMIVAVNQAGFLDEVSTAKIWDISITKNVFALLVSVVLLLIIFTSVAKSYSKQGVTSAPKGLQSFLEPIILFVRDDIAKPSIGKNYAKFMPFLLTLFFFIWINNILGLIPIIPGGANLTGNIAVPIVLAFFTFVITTLNGNAHYWKHIIAMPGVPIPVLLILTPIELLGVFIKPFTLIIRLFANITAGHIVMLVFFSLIFMAGDGGSAGAGFGVAGASTLFTIFLNCLELLVGAIQAYVFTLLSAIYFGMAIAEPEHH